MKVEFELKDKSEKFLVELYFLLRNNDSHAAAGKIVAEIRKRKLNPHDVFEKYALVGELKLDG